MNVFDIVKNIILAIVQGITEFLPISASGHLEVVNLMFGDRPWDFHLFMEFATLGCLIALLVFYRKRIWGILKDAFKERKTGEAFNLLLTAIPAGLIGFFFAGFFRLNEFFSNLVVIAAAFLVVGVVMIMIDKMPQMSKLENETKLTPGRAILIGLAEVFAFIPGVSRTASSIVAGRLVGLNSRAAADYSFLSAIPLLAGVCIRGALSTSARAYFIANLPMMILVNVITFALGFAVLHFLQGFLRKRDSLQKFGWYRVAFAGLILFFLLLK